MTTPETPSAGTTSKPPEAPGGDEQAIRRVTGAGDEILEQEVADACTIYFNSAMDGSDGWAWQRLPVQVEFYVGASGLFRVRVENATIGPRGKVSGTIFLRINIGFLVQNPGTYLKRVLPEVVARAIDQVVRISKQKKGEPIAEDSWKEWYGRLTSGADPLSTEEARQQFKKLGALISEGRALGECRCEGAARFHALEPAQLQKVGQSSLRCEVCKDLIVLAAEERRPYWLTDEVQFLSRRLAGVTSAA